MTYNEVVDLIKNAIEQKKSLSLNYQGHFRVINPYLLGETQDKGLVLHAFQHGGTTSKGEVTPETGGWRYFHVNEIQGQVVVTPDWYPQVLIKSEGEYKPPRFITGVVAIHKP